MTAPYCRANSDLFAKGCFMGAFVDNYTILTDASVDIDLDIAKQGNIKIIPMSYSIGGEMRSFSGVLSSSDYIDFYYSQRQGDLTKTSKITLENFEKYFHYFAQKGISVLYISLSSGLSDSFGSAMKARDTVLIECPGVDIRVVDSFCATGGMGLYVERAIYNRAKGMNIEENYNDLCAMHGHVHVWFYVQDLGYLRRGGRISAASSVFGNMLNIKPVLRIDREGRLVSYKNLRGSENAQNMIFELFKAHYDDSEESIYIIDADSTTDAEAVYDLVSRFNPRGEIKRKTLSPVIGAHTGPGMVGICHVGKKSSLK